MYLPRSLIGHLYLHLQRTHHALSPPVLVLVALEPDALCACRILTGLLKRDYIPHKIQPIAGYGDLARAGEHMVRPMRTTEAGAGGVVVCLGVGGLIDLSAVFGFDEDNGEPAADDDGAGGVEVWVVDARRPWNLANVFSGGGGGGGVRSAPLEEGEEERAQPARSLARAGVEKGRIMHSYRPGRGGIVVFDDGDIDEDLGAEREAWCALEQMPDVDDEDDEDDEDDDEQGSEASGLDDDPARPSHDQKKRKACHDRPDEEDEGGGSGGSGMVADGHENGGGRRRKRRRNEQSPSRPRAPSGSRPDDDDDDGGASPPSHPPAPAPSRRALRRQLRQLRHRHEAVLARYSALGNSYSEPISSMMYSLASELGREDNDGLWLAIIGVGSLELYGRGPIGVGVTTTTTSSGTDGDDDEAPDLGGSAGWGGARGARIRQVLRDEVRRLNAPGLGEAGRELAGGGDAAAAAAAAAGLIPTHARSPTDTSIRLSPEPRFLLIRHWSLYDSMLHSPYLSARLHIWTDAGRKRLHKLLAKMGVSLSQCRQSYTHMDLELKRGLRARLLKYAPVYGLEGLVPPETSGGGGGAGRRAGAGPGPAREGWGFVRNWGFKACLSATDVAVVVGAILEVGRAGVPGASASASASASGAIAPEHWDRSHEGRALEDEGGDLEGEEWVARFWDAYDALENIDALTAALPTAMHLHRAILRTGTALIEKRQIRHLRAFRMAVVKDGPDVPLFTHPAALTKLALWVAEAIAEQERERAGDAAAAHRPGARGTPLVMAGLNERRGVYVVVGTGSGSGSGGWGLGPGPGRAVPQARAALLPRPPARIKDAAAAAAKLAKRAERRRAKEARIAEREGKRGEREDDADEDDDGDEGSSSSSDDDDDDSDGDPPDAAPPPPPPHPRPVGHGLNRFGNAFQEVVRETQARVRIDSFEHCVVEVRKEDLAAFLESLSMKAVVG
ncbi:MAG: hypothetical protein M1826_002130 [Phylliscum demangeonii]|nr:MAG: hypothetical protein M1826_002130 [Phylliscum demangeonii]